MRDAPGTRFPSPAAHRRHGELVAAARLAIDLFAFAELQIARETDAHLAEARSRAGYRNALAIQFRVRLHEGFLYLVRRNRQRGLRLEIFRRDLDERARLADGLEVGTGGKPGADSVLLPFIDDQAARRHKVEHRG